MNDAICLPDGKVKLLTLDHLDQRTTAARGVRELIGQIERDLGGDLSTAQNQISVRAAITGAVLEDMAAKWLAGGALDAALWATLCNVERRLYETLGVRRVPRNVKTLSMHLASKREASA